MPSTWVSSATTSEEPSTPHLLTRTPTRRAKAMRTMNQKTSQEAPNSRTHQRLSTSSLAANRASPPNELKSLLRDMLSFEPAVPRPLQWSQVPILFSRHNQWTSFSELGKFPHVLDLVVASIRLTRVLIDGRSGLNLFFASSLQKMGSDFIDMFTPSKGSFLRHRTRELSNTWGRTNLNYTGSSTQILSLKGSNRTSNGVTPWLVG
jgi:hypothetical protein